MKAVRWSLLVTVLILGLGVCLAQGTSPETAEQTNIVANPGFEEGLAHWDITLNDSVGAVGIDASESYQGSQALCMTSESNTYLINAYQDVPVAEGGLYYIKAAYKTAGVRDGVWVRLQFKLAVGANIAKSLELYGRIVDGEWCIVESVFEMPALAEVVRLELLMKSEGVTWWDAIVLEPYDGSQETTRFAADILPSGAVTLSWSTLETPLAYRVYRTTMPDLDISNYPPIGITQERGFVDRNTLPGRTYYYRIVPEHGQGRLGDPSEELKVEIPAAVIQPAKPIGFFDARWSDGAVRLSWVLSRDARARQIRLERTVGEGPWELLSILPYTVVEFTDQSLAEPDGRVRYRLTIIDPEGKVADMEECAIGGYIPRVATALRADEHPRLFMTSAQIAEIRKRAETDLGLRVLLETEIKRPARTVVIKYLTQDTVILPEKSDDGAHFNLIGDAVLAAYGYAFTDEPSMATVARRILLAYAENYKDYPLGSNKDGRIMHQTLDEAVWLVNVAFAYDLIYNSPVLSDQDRQLIDELLWEAVRVIDRNWSTGADTWQNKHCAGIGAVAFFFNDPAWIEKVLASYARFGPADCRTDGISSSQSISHHYAGMHGWLMLAEMAYNNGYDLYSAQYQGKSLRLMLDATFYYVFSNGNFPLMGHAHPGERLVFSRPYALGLLRYGAPEYHWLAQRVTARSSRLHYTHSLHDGVPLWFYSVLAEERPMAKEPAISFQHFGLSGRNVSGSTLFADTGVVLLRSAGILPQGPEVCLLYKPHGVTVGHQGADNLTFMLEGLGTTWVPGRGDYQYSAGHPEQGTWYEHTVARSGVVVDEQSQHPQGIRNEFFLVDGDKKSSGRLEHFLALPSLSLVIGSTDAVYDEVAMERMVINTGHYVVDRFQVRSRMPRQYDWVMHVAANPGPVTVDQEPRPGVLGERAGYQHIRDLRRGITHETWQAQWSKEEGHLALTMLGAADTEVISAIGWGPALSDQPLIIARRNAAETTFLSVLELYRDGPVVVDVAEIVSDQSQQLRITRLYGDAQETDVIAFATTEERLTVNEHFSTDGSVLGVFGTSEVRQYAAFFLNGTALETLDCSFTSDALADVALEVDQEVYVITQNSPGMRNLSLSKLTDAVSYEIYQLGANEDHEVIAEPVTEVVREGDTLTWLARPLEVYVVSKEEPTTEWLSRFSVEYDF